MRGVGGLDVSRGTNSKKVTAKRCGKDDLNLASSPVRSSGVGAANHPDCSTWNSSAAGRRVMGLVSAFPSIRLACANHSGCGGVYRRRFRIWFAP